MTHRTKPFTAEICVMQLSGSRRILDEEKEGPTASNLLGTIGIIFPHEFRYLNRHELSLLPFSPAVAKLNILLTKGLARGMIDIQGLHFNSFLLVVYGVGGSSS